MLIHTAKRISTIPKDVRLPKPEHESTFKISTTKPVVSKDRLHKEVYQKRRAY